MVGAGNGAERHSSGRIPHVQDGGTGPDGRGTGTGLWTALTPHDDLDGHTHTHRYSLVVDNLTGDQEVAVQTPVPYVALDKSVCLMKTLHYYTHGLKVL